MADVAWTFGPLATARASYRARAQAAASNPLRLMVLSDSTSDGFVGGGVNGGSTAWEDVWPGRLAKLMRQQLILPTGGRGWVPPSTPTWPGGYDYDTTIRRPANYTEMDELNFQVGIPGALWLQEGDPTEVYDVEYPLSPGTTAVDIVTTGYGGNINVTCANAASSISFDSTGDRKFTRVNNPGSSVRIVGASGVGFAMLGIYEYVGDENAGVRMLNLAQASIQAAEIQGWLGNSTFSMKPLIGAYQPDVALIVGGSNDLSNGGKTPAQAMQHMGGIAQEIAQVAPNCVPVFILRPNPAPEFQTFAQLIRDNAASVGAEVLDLRNEPRISVASNPSLFVADQVHFTAAGDIAMSKVIADYLKVEKTAATIGGLGDFVYIYWDVSTEFGQAGTITGHEYTEQIYNIVNEGYGYLVPKPTGWTGVGSAYNPWSGGVAGATHPNASLSKPQVESLIAAAIPAPQVVFGTDAPTPPAAGQPPKLWVRDFGSGKYGLIMVTGD